MDQFANGSTSSKVSGTSEIPPSNCIDAFKANDMLSDEKTGVFAAPKAADADAKLVSIRGRDIGENANILKKTLTEPAKTASSDADATANNVANTKSSEAIIDAPLVSMGSDDQDAELQELNKKPLENNLDTDHNYNDTINLHEIAKNHSSSISLGKDHNSQANLQENIANLQHADKDGQVVDSKVNRILKEDDQANLKDDQASFKDDQANLNKYQVNLQIKDDQANSKKDDQENVKDDQLNKVEQANFKDEQENLQIKDEQANLPADNKEQADLQNVNIYQDGQVHSNDTLAGSNIPNDQVELEQSNQASLGEAHHDNQPIEDRQDRPDSINQKIQSLEFGEKKFTREQCKYANAIIRILKKSRDGLPFLEPVDVVKYQCADYYDIIKEPMDLNTVETKLGNASYTNIEQFISDMRLIFKNCYRYNGDESKSPISQMCKNIEETFEKQIKQMPPSEGSNSHKMASTSSLPSKKVKRTSNSKSVDGNKRPRREIHPVSRDLPYSDTKPKRGKNSAQMRFCGNVLKELFKKQHQAYAFPFYQPVNPVALNIPDYHKIIKQPMDLFTIQTKHNDGVYESPDDFKSDIRLMFQNCYKFNPPGTPVNNMGRKLELVFDKKWAELIPEMNTKSYDDDDDSSPYSMNRDDDDLDQLAVINKTIHSLQDTLKQMQAQQKGKFQKNEKKNGDFKKRRTSKSKSDPPIVTKEMQDRFVQKMQTNVTSEEVEVIIQVLREYMPVPEFGELEIEPSEMSPDCFHRIYRFLFKGEDPMRKPEKFKAKKRNRSYTEQQQVEKIKLLQAQLTKFGSNSNVAAQAAALMSNSANNYGSDEDSVADSDVESSDEE